MKIKGCTGYGILESTMASSLEELYFTQKTKGSHNSRINLAFTLISYFDVGENKRTKIIRPSVLL